jgi:hypothetical protein
MKTYSANHSVQSGPAYRSTPMFEDVRGGSISERFSSQRQSGSRLPSSRFQCGEIIPGLKINDKPAPYPVMNERAVRATAGLMLITTVIAFSLAFFMKNFLLLKIITPVLFVDFTLRVFTGMTRFSPFGILGTLLVRNQKPEWVGAAQKRFAWSIGIAVALLMTIITNMNITGALPLSFCAMCMSLMWMETALGVCVGCVIYKWLVRSGVMKAPQFAPACAGSVCDPAVSAARADLPGPRSVAGSH